MTLEPNFTAGTQGRITIKDIFKPGVSPTASSPSRANGCWGYATLETDGQAEAAARPPGRRPRVRRAHGDRACRSVDLDRPDQEQGAARVQAGRVRHAGGRLRVAEPLRRRRHGRPPTADLRLLRQGRARGQVGRPDHPVLAHARASPCPPGEYTWKAICAHRASACGCAAGPATAAARPGTARRPPTGAATTACRSPARPTATSVYLGWTGAEAGKALLACDLQGNSSGRTPQAAWAAPSSWPSTAASSTSTSGPA